MLLGLIIALMIKKIVNIDISKQISRATRSVETLKRRLMPAIIGMNGAIRAQYTGLL